MVLSLPMTQCHSGGPVILSLSWEMPSSCCCPLCATAYEPHLNPRLFSLSYCLCSGCLCLYHPSSICFGHFGNHQNAFSGVYEMETKWRVKRKDHLYSPKQHPGWILLNSVEFCCSSRKDSSQKKPRVSYYPPWSFFEQDSVPRKYRIWTSLHWNSFDLSSS